MAVSIKTSEAGELIPKKSSGELAGILAQIRKDKGDRVIIKGSDVPMVKRIPTGMFEFDDATGGGFPRGRYTIVYGPESSGKTNVTLAAIASAQRLPPPCNKAVFIDLEGTFDPKWAREFGVDTDELIVVKPSYGEEAVDLLDAVVRADDVAIVVLDSLATVVSSKEIEQSAEKFDVGTAAILVKRMCNKLVIALAQEEKRDHTPAVILINQTRFKVGVMFGDPETIPGGQTMKFLSSLTIRVYGKNKILKEVNPDLPAFKETVAVIKKAKVPITKMSFEYDMCVYPHDGIRVGQTRSWTKVMNELKQLGHLTKSPKGWKLKGGKIDMDAPTLVVFQDTYEGEPEFAQQLQQLVTDSHKGQMILVEAEGAAK